MMSSSQKKNLQKRSDKLEYQEHDPVDRDAGDQVEDDASGERD